MASYWSVAVFAFALAGPLCLAPPVIAQQVYTIEPPAEIAAHLDQLRKREDRARGVFALAARDDAAPYLRMELKATADKFYTQDLNEALQLIEKRAYERNRKRYAWWATMRRFDLCTELLVDCPNNADAVELADLALIELHKVRDEAVKALGPPAALTIGMSGRFAQYRYGPTHFAGDIVSLPKDRVNYDFLLVRANVWELAPRSAVVSSSFVAARSEIRYPREGWCEWNRSTILMNNAMAIQEALLTIIVCDGDVVLDGRHGSRNDCVIIANGDIRSVNSGGANHSFLCATGDIGRVANRDSRCHAGGTVTFTAEEKPSDRVKEKQKSLPFGVRFLDPREFGLELAAQNGGIQVIKISPESPFARYGVKDRDVITSVNDVTADSIATFRRQLRQAVVRESVVLRIRRGDQRISRVVFLDGIPLSVAPPPRPAKP